MFAPTTFGKYYLFEKLATGGMAEIYKGKLLGPGGFEKVLVIKQVLPALARRREFIELFVEEAKTTVSLSHGNIVPIYELGVIDGTYYTAMEYIDGPTLYELASAVRRAGELLPVDLAVWVAIEVLHGLDYAHRKATASGAVGVVHRDLSPRNVMLSREGEVKILDFGIALAGEGGAGELAGSYAYMSPEQASRRNLDTRSDLFSCGILMWELLTGKLLFTREKPDDTLEAVRAAKVAPPSSVRPEVPEELDAVVLRALAPEVAGRAQNAQELLAPLMKWLYGRADPAGAATLVEWVEDYCPRGATIASAPATQVGSQHSASARPSRPETPREEKTFATNVVELMQDATVAEDTKAPRTKAMTGRTRAISDEEAAAGAPKTKTMTGRNKAIAEAEVASPSASPLASPSPRWIWLVLVLIVAGGAAGFIALRPSGNHAQAPALDAAMAALVPDAAVDAAPPPARDAAPPDAAPSRRPDAGPRPHRDAGAARPDAAAAGPTSLVTIGANPYADVSIDGTRRGGTPARDIPLAPGKHTVKLTCPPESCPPVGREFSFQIDVRPGEPLRRAVDFTGPEPVIIE